MWKSSTAALLKAMAGTVINNDCDFDVLSGELEMCSSKPVQTSLAEQRLLSETEQPHLHTVYNHSPVHYTMLI